MKANDVLTIGKLVLASVVVGAALAVGGQAAVQFLLKLVSKWPG